MPDASDRVMKTYSTLLQAQTGAVRTITTNRPRC